jgi:hypothetical protein
MDFSRDLPPDVAFQHGSHYGKLENDVKRAAGKRELRSICFGE